MLFYVAIVREEFSDLFKRTGFGKEWQKAMRKGLIYWHGKYAPRHFDKSAYRRYPMAYGRLVRKEKGEPLVQSGSLRGRVVSRLRASNIKSTSKMARLTIPLGEPGKLKEEDITRRAAVLKSKNGAPWKAALRQARNQAKRGYSSESKHLLNDAISEFNPQEEREMAQEMRRHMYKVAAQKRWRKRTIVKA